jgi:ribonuclease H / adenosylcobalamin/alpha-ribazole phosphatase
MNLQRRRMGSIDAPLAQEGRDQAIALAERVRGLRVGEVWSSPLARARDTAEIVARALDLPVLTDPDLREMSMGAWEGLTHEEIEERYPHELRIWMADPEALVMDRYERLADVQVRAVAAIERIVAGNASVRPPGSAILVVTHLNVLRLLAAHFARQPVATYASHRFRHCSLSEVARADGKDVWRTMP